LLLLLSAPGGSVRQRPGPDVDVLLRHLPDDSTCTAHIWYGHQCRRRRLRRRLTFRLHLA
jgi:hypothetical protein